jgi:hypothetical protein
MQIYDRVHVSRSTILETSRIWQRVITIQHQAIVSDGGVRTKQSLT